MEQSEPQDREREEFLVKGARPWVRSGTVKGVGDILAEVADETGPVNVS
ncbi:hypothetical protein ACFU98_37960 [Streptomyces sp. NPDC057575]